MKVLNITNHEMYIKTTVRYYLILAEWLYQKKQTITNIEEDAEEKEALNTAGSNVKWYSLYGRQCVCVCVCVVSCVQLFVIPIL